MHDEHPKRQRDDLWWVVLLLLGLFAFGFGGAGGSGGGGSSGGGSPSMLEVVLDARGYWSNGVHIAALDAPPAGVVALLGVQAGDEVSLDFRHAPHGVAQAFLDALRQAGAAPNVRRS